MHIIYFTYIIFLFQYEIRFGTETDCMKLLETFKGFNFITKEFNNLKKDEILKMLEDIPKIFGVDYDCIFVCILSHGYEGKIILNYFSNYIILVI